MKLSALQVACESMSRVQTSRRARLVSHQQRHRDRVSVDLTRGERLPSRSLLALYPLDFNARILASHLTHVLSTHGCRSGRTSSWETAGSTSASLASCAIEASEIRLLQRPDGSEWKLGEGGFGAVSHP